MKKLRILLIDDNPDDRALAIRELKKEFDIQVEQITDAEGLANALEKDDFDIVITDYQLGWSNGLEILRATKTRYPCCPVIMFTGTGTEEIAVEAMKAGLDDYVVKSTKHFVRLPAAVRLSLERAWDRQERKRAEEKIKHLNAVLLAIRTVNRFINREKDRDMLLKGVCEKLTETRGYHSSWITLLDNSGGLVTSAEAGLGKYFLRMNERLKGGELTDCGRKALQQSDIVVTEDPLSTCADCPLSDVYHGRRAMTVRLEYGGKNYGLLSSSIAGDFAFDEEEQSLFKDLAGDIALALHSLEMEEGRRRAEEALRESEERLSSFMDSATDAFAVYDSELNLVELNKAALNMCPSGTKREDVIGKHILNVAPSLKEAGRYDKYREVIETGNPFFVDDIVPDPKFGDIHLAVRAFKVDGGLGLIMTDITKRVLADETLKQYSMQLEEKVEERTKELKDAQEELIRREKLAVLGQLAGGVGHELRNPLGVISNAIYYLNTTLPDADETTREYLEIITSEVRNSEKIVSDLLGISRTRPAEREKIALSELVTQVLQKQPPPEGVKVVTEIAPDLPPVFIDSRQIGQVLSNLITNAFQAMTSSSSAETPEGGRVTIIADELRLDDSGQIPKSLAQTPIQSGDAPPDPVPVSGRGGQALLNSPTRRGPLTGDSTGQAKIRIRVSDTGSGISKENIAKIFEPLFTTRARGIGLGLAVSKNLVEVNGGSIEVESPSTEFIPREAEGLGTGEEGKGSTFTVILPTKEVVS